MNGTANEKREMPLLEMGEENLQLAEDALRRVKGILRSLRGEEKPSLEDNDGVVPNDGVMKRQALEMRGKLLYLGEMLEELYRLI